MGQYGRGLAGYFQHGVGSLTLSAGNETARAIVPSGITGALLQAKFLTENFSTNDLVWVVVGLTYIVTTTITGGPPVLTLRKNGVNVLTGGTVTIPAVASGPNEIFGALASWTAPADAPGDAWSLFVSTVGTAGVITAALVYAYRTVTGITDGLLTY